jgi:trehalose-phosphatase
VKWFLEQDKWSGALPVYFGDDDKDEDAFAVIREFGGIPCIVGTRQPNTRALVRLPAPSAVWEWLAEFLKAATASVVHRNPSERA